MNEKTTSPSPLEDSGEINEESYRRLLIELYNSCFWKIILRQSRANDSFAIETLASVDPFKEPTLVARTQGLRQGLFSLENEVNMIVEDERKKSGYDKNGDL